jgi:hypothetical protein
MALRYEVSLVASKTTTLPPKRIIGSGAREIRGGRLGAEARIKRPQAQDPELSLGDSWNWRTTLARLGSPDCEGVSIISLQNRGNHEGD